MITATTIFVYRKRQPDAHRPYRVWGYPVLPAFFVLASAVLLYFSYAENLRNSLIGTLIILAGIPLFLAIRRRYAANLQS
jgi:APA family basic amino acid/polyamine antiporter